jgi:hypothetical protein
VRLFCSWLALRAVIDAGWVGRVCGAVGGFEIAGGGDGL